MNSDSEEKRAGRSDENVDQNREEEEEGEETSLSRAKRKLREEREVLKEKRGLFQMKKKKISDMRKEKRKYPKRWNDRKIEQINKVIRGSNAILGEIKVLRASIMRKKADIENAEKEIESRTDRDKKESADKKESPKKELVSDEVMKKQETKYDEATKKIKIEDVSEVETNPDTTTTETSNSQEKKEEEGEEEAEDEKSRKKKALKIEMEELVVELDKLQKEIEELEKVKNTFFDLDNWNFYKGREYREKKSEYQVVLKKFKEVKKLAEEGEAMKEKSETTSTEEDDKPEDKDEGQDDDEAIKAHGMEMRIYELKKEIVRIKNNPPIWDDYNTVLRSKIEEHNKVLKELNTLKSSAKRKGKNITETEDEKDETKEPTISSITMGKDSDKAKVDVRKLISRKEMKSLVRKKRDLESEIKRYKAMRISAVSEYYHDDLLELGEKIGDLEGKLKEVEVEIFGSRTPKQNNAKKLAGKKEEEDEGEEIELDELPKRYNTCHYGVRLNLNERGEKKEEKRKSFIETLREEQNKVESYIKILEASRKRTFYKWSWDQEHKETLTLQRYKLDQIKSKIRRTLTSQIASEEAKKAEERKKNRERIKKGMEKLDELNAERLRIKKLQRKEQLKEYEKEKVYEYTKELEIKKKKMNLSLVSHRFTYQANMDILFVCSTDGSRNLDLVKLAINHIENSMKSSSKVRFGFIGYGRRRAVRRRFQDARALCVQLENISCSGGGCSTTDLHSALRMVTGMNFSKEYPTRIIFHFTDTPCHNPEFHDVSRSYSTRRYPDKSEYHACLVNIGRRFVHYNLYLVPRGGVILAKKMGKKLKKVYNRASKYRGVALAVYECKMETLTNDVLSLVKVAVKKDQKFANSCLKK